MNSEAWVDSVCPTPMQWAQTRAYILRRTKDQDATIATLRAQLEEARAAADVMDRVRNDEYAAYQSLRAQLADAQARLAVAEGVVAKLPVTGDGHRFGMAHKLYVNIPNDDGEWTVRRCGVLEIIDPDDRHPEDYDEGQRYKIRIRDTEGEEHEVFMGSLYSTQKAADAARKDRTC